MLSQRGDGNYSVNSIGAEDDLKSLSFNNHSVCLDSRNRLWWGTGDIMTMLDLNTFETVPVTPAIQLNDIQINQKFIDFSAILSGKNETDKGLSETSLMMNLRGLKFSDVAAFYNYPVNLKLPHHLNHLTFNFSATDWTAPQSIKYQYILEGMDEEWSRLNRDNKADYRNIPAGKYKFRVKALSKTNVWSETFEYPFIVQPPWWFQWWSYTIYAIVLILLVGYYIRFRISREGIKSEIRIKQIEVNKMKELDQMKSRFFANISHEFRTPLTLLIGPINDLLKNPGRLKEDDRILFGIMKRNTRRLQQLINQLLDLSKLETGNLKLEVAEGDLTGFIKTIILSFLSLAESKNISYKYDLEEMFAPSFYDADKVEKIVTNLISNALKFTPDGGTVIVTLLYSQEKDDASGFHARISVKDTGSGIPDNEKEKIFDRFYQVNNSDSRDHEGSGIGLALTRELVDLYRGKIKVESVPGEGSIFTIILPVSRDQFKENEIIFISENPADEKFHDEHVIPVPETVESDVQEDTISEKNKEKPVILIVEDNRDLRKYISNNLLNAYQIIDAENGREGLNKAIENIPDLVISDLMMPEMNGMEMCDGLKKDTRTNHIPLIMLTAKADRESKLGSLETGADDYIIKPFDAGELQVRVKNLIEQRKKLREHYRKEFLTDTVGQVIPSHEDEFLVRFMECVKKHLKDPRFTVEQLGKELHLSRVQLYRKVLSLTDCSPGEFIRNIRLKTAATMFLEGHTNVTSVLYSVGYSTPSHFTQSFRELFGINPSEYIKLHNKSTE
jgi:signal transduction histidine kinase/DNA-binding response OmpR family regulator